MGNLHYFRTSLILTFLGILAGFWLGGPSGALIVAILCVLEISLSFDNAVVNATVLKDMDEVWRKRFLTWGMLIAVFGMRIVFPVLIVAIAAQIGPIEAIQLALNDENRYAELMTGAHHQIAAFGGAFLGMVFLKFFVDQHKEEHWLRVIEAPLTRLGRMDAMEIVLVLLALVTSAAYFSDLSHRIEFVTAGVWGLIAYVVSDGIGELLGGDEGKGGEVVAKTGLAGFLYLEMLDASFSFDGVIGAFALTKSLPIIAIGLGIGAMFVRSFTIVMVEKGTLAQYRYLEHGAFWAIGALAAVMLVGVHVHIPEVITGVVGAVLIGLSFWASLRSNRKDSQAAA
ncbi:DUF475 domain-containing protein [Nostoc sp. CHAB 5834]|nr:DUF475 domain-containing protein [Nostoc sp. CHAB 5834]